VDSKEVEEIMNRIAEACAELALYRVLIRVDGILEYYNEPALAGMDKELWKLLGGVQASEILTKEAIRKGKD
jgi:hypothetical protein